MSFYITATIKCSDCDFEETIGVTLPDSLNREKNPEYDYNEFHVWYADFIHKAHGIRIKHKESAEDHFVQIIVNTYDNTTIDWSSEDLPSKFE